MISHIPFYNELYKFTNEYRENESKKIINKFIFKQPSDKNSDGFKFIDSNILYDGKLEPISNTKIYFKNMSTPNRRRMNKNIRICNIPISKMNIDRNILKCLNKYFINSITNINGEYTSNLESLIYRKESRKDNYPDLEHVKKSNDNVINKYIYGLQFNSLEFLKATGLLITIFKMDKDPEKYSGKNYQFLKISNFEKLNDGYNIRISMQSDNYLEIEFTDTEITESALYQINIIPNVENIKQATYSDLYLNSEDEKFYKQLLMYSEKYIKTYPDSNRLFMYPLIDDSYNITSQYNSDDICGEIITYKNNSMISCVYKCIPSNEVNNGFELVSQFNSISCYDDINNIYTTTWINNNPYISKNMLSLMLNNGDLYKTFPLLDNDYDIIKKDDGRYIIQLKENATNIFGEPVYTNDDSSVLTLYGNIYLDPFSENMILMPELHDIVQSEPYYTSGDNIKENESNLLKSLPLSLQYFLENDTTMNVYKMTRILPSSLVIYNNIPCIKFICDIKHDTFMLFHNNKLITPTFIENKGDILDIYISVNSIITEGNQDILTPDMENYLYKKKMPSDGFILLPDSYYDLWIVYDTDRLFVEDMRYDVRSIYKYINLSTTQRYSMDDTKDYETYIEDNNGNYINYKGHYLELGSTNYYLDNNEFKTPVPDGYTGNIYNKFKTNEYLLPINKNIDPNDIVITIEDTHFHDHNTETKYRPDENGIWIKLTNTRYYPTYKLDNTDLYIIINGEYVLYDPNVYGEDYSGTFYLKYEASEDNPRYIVPPYYYSTDIRYTSVGYKCVKLANVFNIERSSEIVSIDTYKTEFNETTNENELVETKTYTKNELLNKICKEKFHVDYNNINYLYYESSDGNFIPYRSNMSSKISDIYYKKIGDEGYANIADTYPDCHNMTLEEYMTEASLFIDKNIIYKFTLINGEILDGGYADTDEVIRTVDAGFATSYSAYPSYESKEAMLEDYNSGITIYIIIDNEVVEYDPDKYHGYDGPFYNLNMFTVDTDKLENSDLTDDYPVYDFNFSSPYSTKDDQIKAYRIDSSYSNYFINDEDDFLAYVIPNQLINSESKMLTFLDGKFTDEYTINKNLYSRLFGGDTILSFSDNPESTEDFHYRIDPDGIYYFDNVKNVYIADPDRDKSYYKLKSFDTYYKGYDPILEKDSYVLTYLYDKYDIINEDKYRKLFNDEYIKIDKDEIITDDLYYKTKNGEYIKISEYHKNDIIVDNYMKYFELDEPSETLNNSDIDPYFITIEDYYSYTTSYSKSISSVYLSNMKNLTLYQNQRGISYDKGIFTISDNLDNLIINDLQLYKDFYCIPLSTKYMLFFINGKFANPDIEILSGTKFALNNISKFANTTDSNQEINEISIYIYNKFLYNLNKYKNYYFTKEYYPSSDNPEYTIYRYNDTLWNNKTYRDEMINKYKNTTVIFNPKSTGYNPMSSYISLYEIFGKFILNKYDIDSDYQLYDEIHEYFASLFDDDNRMKLELLQDKTKRKYIY